MTFLLGSPASAQDIVFETTCLLKTGIGGVPPGASLDCSAFGVDHEITPATDGINSSDVDTTAFSRLDRTGPGSFTMSAHGSAVSRVLSFPDPARTASAELTGPPFVNNFLMNIRGTPGTRYLLRNTLSVAVAASGPGAGATAGVTTSGCGSVFATTSQTLSSTTASQCVRTADGGGLVAQVRSSLIANVELRGQVRDASYTQSIAFSFSPEGPELLALSAPTQTLAGSPFPQDVRVKAALNTTGAGAAGKLVEFRLKDAAGTVLETLARTTLADGTASANFAVGGGGEFAVEAFCAECVAGSRTVTFPITVLSGELTALPGPREGPVGGTLELAFKATEKVLVGGVVQDDPITGTPVSFLVTGPAADAAFSPSPATTGQDGVARTTLTLGSAAGTYQVTATCAACRALPLAWVDVKATQTHLLELRKESGDGPAGILHEGDNPLVARVIDLTSDQPEDGVLVEFEEIAHPGMPLISLQPIGPQPTTNGGLAVARFSIGELPGTHIVAARCPSCTVQNEVLFSINGVRERPGTREVKAPPVDPSLPRVNFEPSSIQLGYGKVARVCLRGGTSAFLGSLTISSLRAGLVANETTASDPLPDCDGRTFRLQSDPSLCVLKDVVLARTAAGQVVSEASAEAILPNVADAVRTVANAASDCSDVPSPFRGLFRCGYDRYKITFSSEFDLAGLRVGERLSDQRPLVAQSLPSLRQCPFPPILAGEGGILSLGGQFFIEDTLGATIFRPFESEVCGVEMTQTLRVGQCAIKRNTLQFVFPEGGGIRTRRSDHADGLFQ